MNDDPCPTENLSACDLLRTTREARGLTLDEASRVTRIGKNYLTAIEEGRYDRLPNPAYMKGFLRSYAGYLGLPGDDVLRRYHADNAEPEPQVELPPKRAREESGGDKGIKKYLLAGALFVLVLISYMVVQKDEPQPPREPEQSDLSPVKAALPVAAVQKPISTARPVAEARPADRPVETSQNIPASGLLLKMKVNQDCGLTVTIDGSISQDYALKAGDVIEWKADSSFDLDLDNPGGVEAELNGRGVKLPQGESPAHVTLKGNSAGR